MTISLSEEKKLWKKGYKRVIGLDEVGRGALAGPVMAAAVIVKKFPISNFQFSKIKDSKKFTPKLRDKFYKILTTHSGIKWAIGKVSEKVIDKINILEATKLAMKRAVKNLNCKLKIRNCKTDFLIIDGNFKLDLPIPQKFIVKADEKVFSCAAASIIAKVRRDRIMLCYHKRYPQYGFDRHKGYPTKFHRKMLKRYGPSVIHRKSFTPVKNMKKDGPLISSI
ncbi:MAG: ribonuclease HII [Patescibacteria group bacterium]|nr:ribonuclease HII [Patescibacteria group bacterium]